MAAEKIKAPSLDSQVGEYWKARNQNGVAGLALLDKCIQRVARYKDWDALSRFVVASMQSNNRAKVVKIVRAAFGNHLSFKVDKKHATGGVFTFHNWPADGPFNLKASNTYGVVRAAVDAGLSWDDKSLQKELPSADKKARTVSAEAQAKVAKHVLAYLEARAAEGFNIGEAIAAVQKELSAKKASVAPRQVVNGGLVIEPEF